MATKEKTVLTVQADVNAPIEKVWEFWTGPEHIKQWNSPSDEWHTTKSENDLREGGNFSSRMEAKDGSAGFDFAGTYTKVKKHALIEYVIGDGREVKVVFTSNGNSTRVVEDFEAEDVHSIEMQQGGWQAIMDNFKKYTESN